MPKADVGCNGEKLMRRMLTGPVAQGVFGWPIAWHSVRYLVDVGYARIVYDWLDRRVKAELTDEGRAYIESEIVGQRVAAGVPARDHGMREGKVRKGGINPNPMAAVPVRPGRPAPISDRSMHEARYG